MDITPPQPSDQPTDQPDKSAEQPINNVPLPTPAVQAWTPPEAPTPPAPSPTTDPFSNAAAQSAFSAPVPAAPVFVSSEPAFTPNAPVFTPTVPEATALPSAPVDPGSLMPQPVIVVFSPRGLEYVFMAIALFTAAFAFSGTLLSLVNGQTGFSVLAVPVAALVVAVPVFAFLFLRLKKAELNNPSLRFDASKRRTTQVIQISAFVVSFFTLIGLVGILFAKMGGQYGGSIGKAILDVLVVLLVAGGILAYYWHDEHRAK